ncbi:MAG: hypothetical protein ABIV50_06855, partial [Opitutus sp.]
LHQTALEIVLPRDASRFLAQAQTVLTSRSIPEKQQALELLAKAASPKADVMLQSYAEQLVANTCPPQLQLDVIEALRTRSGANQALAAVVKTYAATPAAAAYRELEAGGDPDLGRTTIQTNLASSCLSCHAITAKGGSEVGPNLSTIGAHRDAAYLVESLVMPSAKVAAGYGVVSATLNDGSNVTGTLATETPGEITIRLFDGNRRTINRSGIKEQTAPISVMPPMLGVLQPREIRNVVAYLSSLTGRKPATPATKGEDNP